MAPQTTKGIERTGGKFGQRTGRGADDFGRGLDDLNAPNGGTRTRLYPFKRRRLDRKANVPR